MIINGIETYKFSQSADASNPPDIMGSISPKEYLNRKYTRGCMFGLDNLKSSGCYKYMGWMYNFRPYLKRFLVKQYDDWQEVYAPNKTALRNSTYGRIQEIVAIQKDKI